MGKPRVHIIQSEKRPLACSSVSQEGRREESRLAWESRFSEGVGGAWWGIAFMRLGCTHSYSRKCDAQASRFMRSDCKSLPRPWWGVSGARIHARVRASPPMHHKLLLRPLLWCCKYPKRRGSRGARPQAVWRECPGDLGETKIPLEDASYDSFRCGAWLCKLGQAPDYRAGRASQQRYS